MENMYISWELLSCQTPIPLLFLTLLIPVGFAYADSEGYTREEIVHSFQVMKQYTAPNDQLHLQIDPAAYADSAVGELDIEIIRAFTIHNNEMMDIFSEELSDTNMKEQRLQKAIQSLQNGKFNELFSRYDSRSTHSGLYQHAIMPMVWIQRDTLVTPTMTSATACGGGFDNPHPDSINTKTGRYATVQAAINVLISDGYHKVPLYATIFNYGKDYAKTTSAYGCSNGEFRLQSLVESDDNGSWRHSNDSAEPNPEINAYDWPIFWWGPYVAVWHVNN